MSSNIKNINKIFTNEDIKESIKINLKPVSVLDKNDSKSNDSVNDSKSIL